jgi:Zn-dependent peptidase ImmA (M78 family)
LFSNFPYPIFKIDLYYRNTKVNYFLGERDDRFNYWKQRKQEKEAEVFATYLLIPEDKLNEKLKEEFDF